ncbi:Flp pilus assembly protein CpaB [Fervidicola ferrireducens]|uniref:Flp pilus assembly protein CpaB n=1 Tax=Fervidicola ferrireducens TaxID=520764 RepID=UPI0009FAC29A|nr:Flp pilus assembly protein CpaB [Fervidicola ferrireducens]
MLHIKIAKKNTWVLFTVIAVIFGLIAAYTSVSIVRKYTDTDKVVIAAGDIRAYRKVTLDDVKVVEIPKVAIPSDAVKSLNDIVGKYLMYPVSAGDIIRASKIADMKISSLLSAQLTHLKDPKMRAFALPFTKETGLGGNIEPGDRVDIVASVKIDTNTGPVGVGKIVAQNVQVLQVEKPSSGGTGIVIVALTPQQIEDIAFALTSGQLRFALNPYETDVNAAKTEGVTGKAWFEKYGFTLPGEGTSDTIKNKQ